MAGRRDQDPGRAWWNPETQSWDDGAPRAAFTPPPPPRPGSAPRVPGEPGAGDGAGQRGRGAVAEPAVEHGRPAARGAPGTVRPVPLPELPPDPVPPWYRRRGVVVGLVLAVAIGGGGFTGWFLAGRGDGGGSGTHSAGPSRGADTPAAPSPSPTPTVAVTPTPSPGLPPSGYLLVTEPEFTLFVPEDWQRRTEKGEQGVTLYYYEEPGGGPRRIQVFEVTEENATPRGTLELAETFLDGAGYRRNSLADVSDPRGPAAELDYSGDSEQWDTRMRTVDRVVHGGDEKLYAVLSTGPADDWPAQRDVHRTVLDGLCFETEC